MLRISRLRTFDLHAEKTKYDGDDVNTYLQFKMHRHGLFLLTEIM